MEDVLDDNTRQVEELTGMDQDGNKLVDNVARVDKRPSITGNIKRWCSESLSQRDLLNLLTRKTYLSDSPLNYYRYLLLELDLALCAKVPNRLRSWIFPTNFMTQLERGSQKELRSYGSKVQGECLSFENIS